MAITAVIIAIATGSLAADRPAAADKSASAIEFAEVIIRRQTIIRLPVRRGAEPSELPRPEHWAEKEKVKCLPIDNIGGAIRSSDDGIDLVVRGGERWRVHFSDRCPALDFYQGFYFKPDAEHKLCAKRDVVYSRSGGECRIWSIRRLELKSKR